MKKRKKGSLRDYGLPEMSPTSIPKAEPAEDSVGPCPNCKCESVFKITLKAEQPLLRGKSGTATYYGCPACPWASPAMLVASRK